jgi:hypothetical protein
MNSGAFLADLMAKPAALVAARYWVYAPKN